MSEQTRKTVDTLEVGDTVVIDNRGFLKLDTVEKITKTRIVCKEFGSFMKSTLIRVGEANDWRPVEIRKEQEWYSKFLMTAEDANVIIEEKTQNQRKNKVIASIRNLGKDNWNQLSIEELEEIYEKVRVIQ